MPQSEKDIILRTEAVNEILAASPKWILRFGITVVTMLIVIGVTLCYFIKYPDVLTAPITITTLNPPVSLVAKSNGKLTHLFVKDKTTVKVNEVLGVIENTGNYKDVLYLQQEALRINEIIKQPDATQSINLKDSLKTGELTTYYLQCLKAMKDLNLFVQVNAYNQQISLIKKDLINYHYLLSKYKRQLTVNTEQLQLAEADYQRDKKLFETKAISQREFETQKRNYLNATNSNEQAQITVSNQLIQINSLEKSMLQLQIQQFQEYTKLKTELSQQLKTLQTEILKWKQLYLIESPVSGKVSFFNVWVVNQQVKLGDELMAIIPTQQHQQFIGKCVVPLTNTGKLAVHQKVNIKLDNYPYNENGMLQGLVANISEVPTKDGYIVDVAFPNGLTTSYHKALPYKQQMKGEANIITKNASVLDRVFFNFKKMMDRK